MTMEALAALATFAFVTSITPGPNNLMLMASGANFGLRRTLPHMLGVGLGFMLMLLLVGSGLAGLFQRVPLVRMAMLALSVTFLLYLAWKIANAAPPEPGAPRGRPITFLQAVAFQWVNPKAWAMALTALTVHAPGNGPAGAAIVALVFGAVNLPAVGSWTLLGTRMQRLLATPGRLRLFNRTMAVLLLTTLYPLLSSL